MSKPIVAIDATLAFGTNTGDSTYWTGLLAGLAGAESPFDYLLLSDQSKPAASPFDWKQISAGHRRWRSLVAMPMAARRAGANVYHTQYTLSPLVRNGVTTIHDVSFFIGPEWFKPKDRLLMQRTVPASAKRAKKVITVSESSKLDVVKFTGVPSDKVVVTYNAAPPWFKPMTRDEAAPSLKKLGIETPYLLAIGARWPRKNLALAIRAAELLPARLPHRLLVVGKEGWGDEGGGARTVATGYMPNESLPPLYAGAELFLFPSLYEGFGIPMVEAFASGTPVLASSGGSLPEVSGGAAEIVRSFDALAWASAIEALLDDSSKIAAMRERGLIRSKDFSWKQTATRTIEVYAEVAR
ncbi:MAG: glycosyltransferase family 4 protein [Armatimonadota bacterium]|nr:glycosyltransferase family 4 protein [Armatimonadota bacterium]